MPVPPLLTIKYAPIRPVELLDLTASLHALGLQYQQFVEDSGFDPESGVRLYIEDLRKGSIIATLRAIVEQTSFVHDHIDLLVAFASQVHDLFQFFLTFAPTLDPPAITRKQAEQLSNFIEPIAKDGGAQLFLTVGDNSQVTINQYTINSQQASAAQNNIRRFLGKPLPESGHFINEVMYLRQASGDIKARAGDRGVIEKFSDRAVKLRFMTDEAKKAVIDQADNPFKLAFVVDGQISTVNGNPALYKIHTVHDVFERP